MNGLWRRVCALLLYLCGLRATVRSAELCVSTPPRPEVTAVSVLAEPLSEVLVVCICLTELGRYSYKSHVSILTEYFS